LIQFWIDDLKIPMDVAFDFKDRLLDNAESLSLHPFKGQKEEFLNHLNKEHRRIVDGHVKIIYRISDESVYITDFFDSRQDPDKMKG